MPNPSPGRYKNISTRVTRLWPATASVPKGAMNQISMKLPNARCRLMTWAGMPIFSIRQIIWGSRRKSFKVRWRRVRPPKSSPSTSKVPRLWEKMLLKAAPRTPIWGKIHSPSTRKGQSVTWMVLIITSMSSGVTVSPDDCTI